MFFEKKNNNQRPMNATSSKRGFLSLSFGFFLSFNAGYHYREEEKVYFLPFLFIISFVHIIHLLYHQGKYVTFSGLNELFWTKVRKIGWQPRFNHVFVEVHTYHEKAYFSMPCLAPTWFRFMKYATDQTYKTCLLKKMSK